METNEILKLITRLNAQIFEMQSELMAITETLAYSVARQEGSRPEVVYQRIIDLKEKLHTEILFQLEDKSPSAAAAIDLRNEDDPSLTGENP